MFKITETLATHGLGDMFIYPHPKDKLVTGKRLAGALEDWIIIDCRDMKDEWNPPIIYAEKIFQILATNGKAVVCCGAGISRSNAVALGYLLKIGLTWEQAWTLIHDKGSIAQIQPGHISALKSLFGMKTTFQGRILDHAEGDYDLEEKNGKAMLK
jgi:hypothetical protein